MYFKACGMQLLFNIIFIFPHEVIAGRFIGFDRDNKIFLPCIAARFTTIDFVTLNIGKRFKIGFGIMRGKK